jgi:diacylglycerol kinase (ATP)
VSARFRHPVLIYNPVAGKLKRNNQRLVHQVVAALRESGVEPRLVPTTGPDTAGPLAKQAIEEGADLIIGFGGDGTINEIAGGVVGSQVPLAILPGGTANVVSIETKVGTQPVKAARRILDRVPHRIAVGRLTIADSSRYFLAMTGVGLDARIVNDVVPRLKKATGKFAYWVAGFKQFLRPLHAVTHNGGIYGFVLASRVRNYGGDLEIARGASLLGDELEVVSFRGTNPWRYALYMSGVAIRQHARVPGVEVKRAKRIEFPEPGAYVQIDGELAGMTPATVEVVPDALTLLLPPDFRG